MYSLLNVPLNFPKLRWVFLGVIGLSIGQVLATFGWPRTYLLEFNNYLFIFTEVLLISTTLYAIVKLVVFNKYLLIPCFITLVPFLFLNLQALGVINFSWTYPLIYFTNFIEILALSLVLGRIIKATEHEKIQTEKALITEKLEADKLIELDHLKTRLFTNISHEFRTPLTLLTGPLEELQQKYPKDTLRDHSAESFVHGLLRRNDVGKNLSVPIKNGGGSFITGGFDAEDGTEKCCRSSPIHMADRRNLSGMTSRLIGCDDSDESRGLMARSLGSQPARYWMNFAIHSIVKNDNPRIRLGPRGLPGSVQDLKYQSILL